MESEGTRFEIVRRLGRGGMGAVFEAQDRLRGMRVALKVLSQPTPDAIYRFKREFRALADVSHRNLVTLYELLLQGEQWMFSMELVDGGDLVGFLRGGGDSRAALAQLVDGVEALHAAGVLHRDIKPSNVLVDRQGRVVLLDFGVVAAESMDGRDTIEPASQIGTPLYMSPEQQRGGRALTAASDWYAVGLTLYEVLTGRRPFAGSASGMLRAKQSEDFVPPRSVDGTVPDELDRLCVALLRADPEQRAGAAEIRRALRLEGHAAAVNDRTALVGREPELAHLRARLDEVMRTGAGAALWVQGSCGVGKTALAEAFLDEVGADPGTVVVAGRCHQRERLPFKGVDNLIDSLTRFIGGLPARQAEALLPPDLAALCHLFPVLRRARAVAESPPELQALPDAREVRERGLVALRELLRRIGATSRLVLFIDDLQWSDEDSAALIAAMMRAPAPRLLLIGTCRAEEGAQLPAAGKLELRPLAAEHAIALARQRLGAGEHVEARAESIARESGGNPYFIAELAENGQLTLDDLIAERVRALPAAARHLLERVAGAVGPIAWACGSAVAANSLNLLRGQRLVRISGAPGEERIEPYHDRIRQALVVRG